MGSRKRRLAGTFLGLTALAVVAYLAVTNSSSEPNMDRRSYERGYGAFADAYLTASEDDRRVNELYCERLWGAFPTDELVGVHKNDWVQGCADYAEGKPSRFE
ncbi:hypothetical protein [Streptomyces sp. NPDC017260]|uniref:hypothetical protein n=1 Tax=unclassified Streptomyces TaxID=2593676 RepID=UPI0037A821FF